MQTLYLLIQTLISWRLLILKRPQVLWQICRNRLLKTMYVQCCTTHTTPPCRAGLTNFLALLTRNSLGKFNKGDFHDSMKSFTYVCAPHHNKGQPKVKKAKANHLRPTVLDKLSFPRFFQSRQMTSNLRRILFLLCSSFFRNSFLRLLF